MGYIIFYIILSLIVANYGADRQIGFWSSLIWSLLLSPLIGLIIMLSSKSNQQAYIENHIINKIKEENRPKLEEEIEAKMAKAQSMFDNKLISETEFKMLRRELMAKLMP